VKITRSQLKELVRQSIYNSISEEDNDKYTHIAYGVYKKKGQEKNKLAPTFKKDDSGKFVPFDKGDGEKEEPEKETKPSTKIKSDPFDNEDEMDGDNEDEPEGDDSEDDSKDEKEETTEKAKDAVNWFKKAIGSKEDMVKIIKSDELWDDYKSKFEAATKATEDALSILDPDKEINPEFESVHESKKRRFTVKEVRMWMKKLEENRYKKVYNSDARRVAWMVNNEGVELSEMPKSMSKKWTKAQYGRERYLATEFIKSKSEQMNEGKLTEKKQGYVVADIYGGVYTKKAVSEKKALAMLNKMAHFGGDKIFMIGVEAWNKPHKMNKKKIMVKEEKLTSEQKLREQIREIIKEQLNEAKMVSLNGQTKDYKKVVKLFKKMKLKSPKQYDLKPTGTNTFTINIDKKFYNKFIELAMNNKIDIRG
jgi:hypothetical protein